MGTGYVTQVLEIVLAADEIERVVALKQTGNNNHIAGRLEDSQIGASITTEIPVVGNVAYRPLNPDCYFIRKPVRFILLCMIVRPPRRNIDTEEKTTKCGGVSVGRCVVYLQVHSHSICHCQ